MIASLTGIVQSKTEKSIIIEVAGVGYEVFTPQFFLEKIKISSTTTVYTHLHIREEAMELYGFPTSEALAFFKLLINVNGVGPKSAVAVLSLASVSDLKKAISHGDASLLMKVSGIGKKIAERLIVELKTKVDVLDNTVEATAVENLGDNQAIDGLVHLGYSVREAREALRAVDPELTVVKDRVKAALKILGKGK